MVWPAGYGDGSWERRQNAPLLEYARRTYGGTPSDPACRQTATPQPRTRCGIHGDPTPRDRCPTCDQGAAGSPVVPHMAAADLQPGQRFAAYSGLACTVERVTPYPGGRVVVAYTVDASYATGSAVLRGLRDVSATHLFPTTDEPF